MGEGEGFGGIELFGGDQRAQGGAYPDASMTIVGNEAHLAAMLDGVTAQVVIGVMEARVSGGGGIKVVDTSSVGGHPNASLAILVNRIDIVMAQAIGVALTPLVAAQAELLLAEGLGLDQAVALGGYPEIMGLILHQTIGVTPHGLARTAHGTRLGKVT